jgi:hypothetical protein
MDDAGDDTQGLARGPALDALDATRARDAHERDPVRFRLAQALARRAGAHEGEARRVIDERVAAILQSLSQLPAQAEAARVVAPSAGRGALAALVAHAVRHRGNPPGATPAAAPKTTPPRAATPSPQVTGAAADTQTVQFFKRTWSRLSADQRLAQSRAALPENAGPLNSQHLVHRALVLMRELSPEYLEHFVGYIDALQWLEQASEAATQELTAARAAQARPRSMAARRG